jgi:hypothetical protein
VVLVVDVVSAVLECGALPDASSPFLAVPSAGALGAKYLRRIEAQSQIADSDLVLDSHAGSVGRRTDACDQRNKLLGSQRAAGRTGGNQISPALRLNLVETHRGPAQVPGRVIERDPERFRTRPRYVAGPVRSIDGGGLRSAERTAASS